MKNRVFPRAIKALFVATALAAVALVLTPSTASAQITFTLNNVSMDSGTSPSGSLSGTFELSSNLQSVLGYDIIASTSPGSPGFTFTGGTYVTTDSSVTANGLTSATPYFQIDATSGGDELRLVFKSLTTTGAVLDTTTNSSTPTYESEPASGGNRDAISGTAAVPEPSAWALGLLAVLGVAVLRALPRVRLERL